MTRTITAIIFVLIMTAGIITSRYTYLPLFALVTWLSLYEFYLMTNRHMVTLPGWIGIITGTGLFVLSFGIAGGYLDEKWTLTIIPPIGIIFILELFNRENHKIHIISNTLTGLVYAAIPFSLLNFMVLTTNGYDYSILLGMIGLVWINDTAAFLFGSMFGRHRLFERISPRKTWEGCISGMAFTIIAGYFFTILPMNLSHNQWMIIAFIVAITATLGDLIESMFKRSAEIKDSGNLFPGHGGVLDRFDSLIFTIPFVYAYLQLIQ